MIGRSVREKLANLLPRRGADRTDIPPQHQAAVLPAIKSDIKVIDANMADE